MALADSNHHVVLLLRLRWQIFVNGLKHTSRRAELGLQALWLLMGGVFVAASSAGFFFAAFGLLRIDRPDLLDLPLWAVFFVWQLAPMLFEGYSPGLNFREVARYPVSFRLYFLLSAIYGLADPAAITCLLWLLSLWLGLVVSRPEWALTSALALLLFAVFNLFLSRFVIGLFERFQSTRRGRESMVVLMFILLLLPQLLQFMTGYWTNMRVWRLPAWALDAVPALREFSPPGCALRIFLLHGNGALGAALVLLSYGLLAFLLLRQQLHAIYLGEIYAEGRAVRRELKVRPGWRLPLVDEVTAAIIEKELRYIRQSSRLLLQLVYPPIIFMLVAFNGPGRKLFFGKSPEAMLAGMAGFILLSLPNLAYNNFGMDKEGFSRWLLSPPPLRKVLLGKNLTHGALITVLYLLSAAVLIMVSRPRLLMLAVVTVVFFAIMIVHFAAGNLVSVYWPKRIELTQMNSRMVSNAAGLASLLVVAPAMALAGIVAFVSWRWQLSWFPLAAGLAILAASFKLYSWLLGLAERYALGHIEELLSNLGA
jgi:hypothetical protein